jgi:hypothetical protein
MISKHARIVFAAAMSALVFGLGGCGPKQPSQAVFVKEIPWIGQGQWLKVETHIHTKFSDGLHTVEQVAERAEHFGCDAIAITDHGDSNLKAASPAQAEAVQAARAAHPRLLILAGLEWNIPPDGGDEHVTVLAPPSPDEWPVLAEFKEKFDDWHRVPHNRELADQGLRWLAERTANDSVRPVVLNNHPSRKRAKSMELVADYQHWSSINDLFIGFEGAPGHQKLKRIGDYRYKERTIDRWDPAVARVGDAWDTLLQQGYDVWAAMATADFHRIAPETLADYWPGEFSETWVYAPERTAAGILTSLRAGAFFGAHGHIVRGVELQVEAAGLPRPARPGEVIQVPRGAKVTVSLELSVSAKDWEGNPNRIDMVELIAVTGEGASVQASRAPAPEGPALTEELEIPEGGLVVRARGWRTQADGSRLMFYTNPVRIRT